MVKVGDLVSVNKNYILEENYNNYISQFYSKNWLKEMLKIRNRKVLYIYETYNRYTGKKDYHLEIQGKNGLIILLESEILKENQLELF